VLPYQSLQPLIQATTNPGMAYGFCPAFFGDGISPGSAGRASTLPGELGQNQPEPVVVTVVRVVVVAVRGTAVPGVVVPAAAA
jgi:hypothetical protein